MDLLRLNKVEVGYHHTAILPPVTLTIRRKTYLGIVGPNGSGKTTLVRTLLGLLAPVRGQVQSLTARPLRFGYVPQRSSVPVSFPLSVLDMVVMGRYPRAGLIRRLNRQALDAAHQALARVGLDHLAARSLPALSGGQFQRALIARALASEPDVLVLDEPTTGMDLVAERSLLDLVATFRDELHLGVLMVSHQLSLVASRAHEVLLVDGQRQQVRHGSVDEVITPASLSELYQQPVTVDRRHGHYAVFLQTGGS